MAIISKSLLFILLLSGFQVFSQEITIQNSGGNLIYVDDVNEIKIRIAGYDSSHVIALCSKLKIMDGEHGNYQIHAEKLDIGEVITLDIYLEKKDGNYRLEQRSFSVARKNDFETKLGNFRNGDKISTKQLFELTEVSVLDKSIQSELGFKITSQVCLLEYQNGASAMFLLANDKISNDLKEGFQKLKPGDNLTFYNIVLQNSQGVSKTGSPIKLSLVNSDLNEVRELKNRSFKTVADLLKIERLSVESFESLTASDENQIVSFSVAFVPRNGNAEFMSSSGNIFSANMKERIQSSLKTGDKIIFDEIYFTRKDGSRGKCPAVVIAVI